MTNGMPRDRILGCACDLFLEAGLDGFSMRKLASRVGVTAPALYRHFDSRESILLEVVSEAFKRMAQYLYAALKGPSPEARLKLAGEAYLEFALENPRYYEIVYASPEALGVEGFPESILADACAVGQFWNDRVRECMDAGILRDDEPERVSVAMWAHAHGLISLHLRGSLSMPEEEFRRFYMDSMRRTFVGIAGDAYRAAMLEASAGSWPGADDDGRAGENPVYGVHTDRRGTGGEGGGGGNGRGARDGTDETAGAGDAYGESGTGGDLRRP